MDAETQAANIAAAASPQIFNIAGRTFILPLIKISDYFAQHNEAKRRAIGNMRDPLEVLNERITDAEKRGKPYSPTLIASLTESAMRAGSSNTARHEPSMEQITAQLTNPDYAKWWLHYLIRKVAPEITIDWVKENVSDDDAFEISIQLGQLAELSKLNPK